MNAIKPLIVGAAMLAAASLSAAANGYIWQPPQSLPYSPGGPWTFQGYLPFPWSLGYADLTKKNLDENACFAYMFESFTSTIKGIPHVATCWNNATGDSWSL